VPETENFERSRNATFLVFLAGASDYVGAIVLLDAQKAVFAKLFQLSSVLPVIATASLAAYAVRFAIRVENSW
jgi:hypothetical protein